MNQLVSRREMIRSSVALAALAVARNPLSAFGMGEPSPDETLIPFLDAQPKGKGLRWEQLTSWITPNHELFSVSHYNIPELDLEKWQLEICGLVKRPRVISLADIKARKRKSVTATL